MPNETVASSMGPQRFAGHSSPPSSPGSSMPVFWPKPNLTRPARSRSRPSICAIFAAPTFDERLTMPLTVSALSW